MKKLKTQGTRADPQRVRPWALALRLDDQHGSPSNPRARRVVGSCGSDDQELLSYSVPFYNKVDKPPEQASAPETTPYDHHPRKAIFFKVLADHLQKSFVVTNNDTF